MADTSARALRLLSLLAPGRRWSLRDLAGRLQVSERTVRRDVDTLRELGYAVTSATGPDGGYRLGTGQRLPPLLFDDDQALAVAVALQTAPTTVFGLGEEAARALVTLRQVMPVELRAAMDSLPVTRLRNYWEFPAPPIAPEALKPVGEAVRRHHLLGFDVLRPDRSRPEPSDDDFVPPRQLEPHHLVVWAGRWYVVGWDTGAEDWLTIRVDRIHPHAPTGLAFTPRELPGGDVAGFVMTSHDRGDLPAPWPCTGRVRMALPAELVARFAPGGSVVEQLDADHTRLTLGAWSWAGIAGILGTFDADLDQVEPAELVTACARLAGRWRTLADGRGRWLTSLDHDHQGSGPSSLK